MRAQPARAAQRGGATFPLSEVVPALISHSAPRPEVGSVVSGFSLTNRSCGSVGLVVFAPLCLLWLRPSLWRQVRCALNPESSPRDWSFAPRSSPVSLYLRRLSGSTWHKLGPSEEKAVLLFRIWPVRPFFCSWVAQTGTPTLALGAGRGCGRGLSALWSFSRKLA